MGGLDSRLSLPASPHGKQRDVPPIRTRAQHYLPSERHCRHCAATQTIALHRQECRATQTCGIEMRGDSDDDSRSKRARTSLEGNARDIANPPNVTTGTAQQHEQHHHQERRATQACLRCRKQKLRCLGGRPCERCVKASKECDFGKPGHASPVPNSNNNTNTNGDVVEDGHGAAAT